MLKSLKFSSLVLHFVTERASNLSFAGSTFLKQAFEGEYPKLLRLFNDLWRRLQQNKLDQGVSSTSVLLSDVMIGLMPDVDAQQFATAAGDDFKSVF